jgi:hypothetical protein
MERLEMAHLCLTGARPPRQLLGAKLPLRARGQGGRLSGNKEAAFGSPLVFKNVWVEISPAPR